MSEWISVYTGLPEEYRDVLLWDGDWFVVGSRMQIGPRKCRTQLWRAQGGRYKDLPVTHWMMLPDPPQQGLSAGSNDLRS